MAWQFTTFAIMAFWGHSLTELPFWDFWVVWSRFLRLVTQYGSYGLLFFLPQTTKKKANMKTARNFLSFLVSKDGCSQKKWQHPMLLHVSKLKSIWFCIWRDVVFEGIENHDTRTENKKSCDDVMRCWWGENCSGPKSNVDSPHVATINCPPKKLPTLLESGKQPQKTLFNVTGGENKQPTS